MAIRTKIIIFRDMIRNINYKGQVSSWDLAKYDFTRVKAPYQIIIPIENVGKLLLFPSGKCRVMGLKQPITEDIEFPFKIYDLKIQSLTVSYTAGNKINLLKLAYRMPQSERVYEPELFPALRMTKFNPACVNVFSSGKIVILGLKVLAYQSFLKSIDRELQVYIDKEILI